MNLAMFSAYKKGRDAHRIEGPGAQCPYEDKRGGRYDHVVTFSRSFQKYWKEGFDDEANNAPWRYVRKGRMVEPKQD